MMVSKEPAPLWLETDWLLGQFGCNHDQTVCDYCDFVRAGVGLPSIWNAVRDQVLLGSVMFTGRLKWSLTSEPNLREVTRIQRLLLAKPLAHFLAISDRR